MKYFSFIKKKAVKNVIFSQGNTLTSRVVESQNVRLVLAVLRGSVYVTNWLLNAFSANETICFNTAK